MLAVLDLINGKIEVTDSGPPLPELEVKDLSGMQTLPGAWRSGVEIDHEPPPIEPVRLPICLIKNWTA